MQWQDLSSLLKRPIAFYPIFATIGGGVCAGIFLSQAYYWTGRTKNQDGWFYKSQQEWHQETALTRHEQEKARRELKNKGLLEEKKQGKRYKLFFKINKDVLLRALQGHFQPLSLEQILESHRSKLVHLSKAGLMRAKKLGIEHEYVDYARVLETNKAICHICNQPIVQGVGQSGQALCFNYLVPLSAGGKHLFDNIKPAHAHCNLIKANKASNPCLDQFVSTKPTSLFRTSKLVGLDKTDKLAYSKQANTETTSEINSEITHTNSKREEEKLEEGSQQEEAAFHVTVLPQPQIEPPANNPKVLVEEKFSAAATMTKISKTPLAKENRSYNPIKGTLRSCASDPWMESEYNPLPIFKQWVYQRHKAAIATREEHRCSFTPSPANAASEIRNDAARAADLWGEFLDEVDYRVEVFNQNQKAGVLRTKAELEEIAAIAPYASVRRQETQLTLNQVSESKASTPLEQSESQTNLLPSSTNNSLVANNFSADTAYDSGESFSVQEQEANIRRLSEMMRAAAKKMSALQQRIPDLPTNEFQKYHSMLRSPQPVLRAEAREWAFRHREELELICDEEGTIIDFEVAF